jgi:hypothetical protein
MKVLFQALYNKFNADTDFKNAVDGQFYPSEVDQERAVCPYAVYYLVTGVADWTFSENVEVFTVQISVYDDSNSVTTIKDVEAKLYALWDDAILSVSGYNFVRMHRQMTQGPVRDRQMGTWALHVDYEIEIRK